MSSVSIILGIKDRTGPLPRGEAVTMGLHLAAGQASCCLGPWGDVGGILVCVLVGGRLELLESAQTYDIVQKLRQKIPGFL